MYFNKFNDADWLFNYSVGFRYELARAFGMHMGVDFAWSNKGDFSFYIILGSPWNR